MHTAELVFRYGDPDTASVVATAVSPEVGDIDGDRATATVTRDADEVHVDVDASDLVALRAGLNTWETLVEVAERVATAGSSAP